ncbi:MAG TPA: aldehyde dehydrogenase [Solibacterales bacterium]|jgi:uncharacterized protein (TIGR02284 family)|nr:aldehyde dehydrogenase [Bryobacterales bacterium]
MALETKEVISTLNDLIETCKDGGEGFRTAAEHVSSPITKSLFSEFSSQRSKFASELQVEVTRLGGEAQKSGSISGAAHRGWLDLKSAVTKGDDSAIVAEAERGEDNAKKHYREAVSKDLPTEVRSIVERQARSVQEAHDKVRSLEVKTSHGGATTY